MHPAYTPTHLRCSSRAHSPTSSAQWYSSHGRASTRLPPTGCCPAAACAAWVSCREGWVMARLCPCRAACPTPLSGRAARTKATGGTWAAEAPEAGRGAAAAAMRRRATTRRASTRSARKATRRRTATACTRRNSRWAASLSTRRSLAMPRKATTHRRTPHAARRAPRAARHATRHATRHARTAPHCAALHPRHALASRRTAPYLLAAACCAGLLQHPTVLAAVRSAPLAERRERRPLALTRLAGLLLLRPLARRHRLPRRL